MLERICSYRFSLFDMMNIKIKWKIKTKYFSLVSFCCFHVESLFTSGAEWTSHACGYLIMPALRSKAVRRKQSYLANVIIKIMCRSTNLSLLIQFQCKKMKFDVKHQFCRTNSSLKKNEASKNLSNFKLLNFKSKYGHFTPMPFGVAVTNAHLEYGWNRCLKWIVL